MKVTIKEHRDSWFTKKYWTYKTNIFKNTNDNRIGEIDTDDYNKFRVYFFSSFIGEFETYTHAEQELMKRIQEYADEYDGKQVTYIKA